MVDSALEGIGIGVLFVDRQTRAARHNARFCELLGVAEASPAVDDLEVILDCLAGQTTHPESFVDSLRALTAHPERTLSTKVRCCDGRVLDFLSLPVIENGVVVASAWNFLDVTEAEDTKKHLRTEVGFRNAIVQTLPDLIWLKDPQGVYLACNGRFEEFFGATEAQILGKTDYDFIDKDLADFFRANDSKAIAKGAPSVNEEWITFASDGHRELLETTKTPMFDDRGELIGVLGIGHDVTKRTTAEAFSRKNAEILEMIASGQPASRIYDEIALMYEARHPGMRCSMLELEDGTLLHGGAPSLPKAYCDAVHGLRNGPDVGSCGTATFTGKRVIVEDIATDPKWEKIKGPALAHGLRCCWSEPIKNSSGQVLGAFGMYYDHVASPNEAESVDLLSAARLSSIVMERDQSQKRIRELAFFDELTGLASRAHFYQHVEELIESARRSKREFGLLYVDLDDFKDINDSLGHDAGDSLLCDIAARLKNISRASDFVARLGGDEFCVVVQDAEDTVTVAAVAERCLGVMKRPVALSTRKITLGCSIGISLFPNDGSDVASLLKAADASLYAAKESGKNRFAFFEPEFTKKAEYRFRVEHNLRDAVETHQLSLVYQPQVALDTGRIVGVEALARWYNPQLGEVPPAEFIPVSERIGEIKPLTHWALSAACSQAVSWRSMGIEGLRMSVNVSPLLFLEDDLVALVRRVIEETGIEPNELQLEVTESVVQTDPDNLSVFDELKELGILLAIDDFGAGYSSFKSLKHLAVDCLKIDRYFINDMLLDHESQILARSMIEIGHRLGHEIVAEGVETAEQATVLQRLGCEMVQGYLFARPMPADQVAELLSASRYLDIGGR